MRIETWGRYFVICRGAAQKTYFAFYADASVSWTSRLLNAMCFTDSSSATEHLEEIRKRVCRQRCREEAGETDECANYSAEKVRTPPSDAPLPQAVQAGAMLQEGNRLKVRVTELERKLEHAVSEEVRLLKERDAAEERAEQAEAERDKSRDLLAWIAKAGERENAQLRERKYVFTIPFDKEPSTETERWEYLSFWLHTDIWEIAEEARQHLDPDAVSYRAERDFWKQKAESLYPAARERDSLKQRVRVLEEALRGIVNWWRQPLHGGMHSRPKAFESYLLAAEAALSPAQKEVKP